MALRCMYALLLAGAYMSQPTTAELTRQHAAPTPAAVSPAAPPDAGEPAVSSPASLPREIHHSAGRGELQKVVKWLRKGGTVDALYSGTIGDGRNTTEALLHDAAAHGHLEIVRMLLMRGASVDLQTKLGITALMDAANYGHLSVVLVLLQHSANLDLQADNGATALMMAAEEGQEACVQTLLQAKANTELLDESGNTALQWAEDQGHTAIADLIQQHAPPPAAATPAAPPDAGEPVMSSPTPLPLEIFESAERGELQKVAKWLLKGGPVDAFCSAPTEDGQTTTVALLHAAAAHGHLEVVRMLLKRGARVDLQDSFGTTALMSAARYGHPSILLVLLQHSTNRDLQDMSGGTALIAAAEVGQEACVQALLRAKANTQLIDNNGHTALQLAEAKGHTGTAEFIQQVAPPQPATASPTAPPDASEPVVCYPTSLPVEIYESAGRGELQTVIEWLGTVGAVDALGSALTLSGVGATVVLLHTAAASGHLEMVRELLKRGVSIDLQGSLGLTALMNAACYGHLSIVLVLLQHLANPDLQNNDGLTALTAAAQQGHEACVQALLQAKANTELLDKDGFTASQHAEAKGHTAITALIRQHTCLSLGLGLAQCAVVPLATRPWAILLVMLGAVGAVAFSRTLTAGPDQHRAARQRRSHRPARHAKAQGRTNTAEPTQQHAALPQPATAVEPQATQAEEEAAQAKAQARSAKKSKKKKAGRATATGDEPSAAPPPVAPTLPPVAAPKPAASAAARAEAALQAAIARGGLFALEVALAAAPREVREGGVGVEARARCDRLLDTQQEAERKARQEAAAEAASLVAAEQVRGVAARDAVRALAASKAREVAAAAAAAAAVATEAAATAEAEANALERAMADGGEGGGSGAAGPSKASEVAAPDQYMCSITAEIMTDPVNTVDGHTYERSAIEQWLKTHNTSPATGVELESKQLIPCHSLRSLIRDFHQAGT